MIMGFGNNVVSSLAADITTSQTTIQVMPGTGAMFAGLLSADYVNSSNTQEIYAKLTLTDAKETVFEICHLTSVSNDILTVVRAQEGTTAKGWSLNDVIANFATRGSENGFVQIEQLQSGHYTAAVAGGTENALTLELPATYFLNGSTDWTLRAPVIIYPIKTNTGSSTLQLTLGGRVLGMFSLRKANNVELNAGDLISGVPFCCVLDVTKTFFTVINPATAGNVRNVNNKGPDANGNVLLNASDVGALTQDQGDARYVNLAGDTMTGNLIAPYVTTAGITATNGYVTINAVYYNNNQYARFLAYAADGTTQLGYMEFDYNKNCSFAVNGRAFSMDNQGAFHSPGPIYESTSVRVYSPNNKPTANDVGAVPTSGGAITGPINVSGQITSAAGYNVYAGQNIIAGSGGVYESNVRVYSPNNPPPVTTSASLGSSGWWKDQSTGMIVQWGSVSRSDTNTTAYFPIAFPGGALNVQLTLTNSAGNSLDNIFAQNIGQFGFTYVSSANEIRAMWLAIGY